MHRTLAAVRVLTFSLILLIFKRGNIHVVGVIRPNRRKHWHPVKWVKPKCKYESFE